MDILLFVLFAGLQLVLAGLGVYVSLKPQPPEYHRRLIVVFILLALLTIIVGVFQQERAGHEQSKLEAQLTAINTGNKQISSKIDSFIPKNEPTRVITSGSPIPTVVEVTKPKGSISKHASTTPPANNNEDQQVIDQLKGIIASQKPWGMTQDQLVTLSKAMSAYASQEDRGDLITAMMNDPDSQRFGNQLVGAFKASGWQLTGSGINLAIFSGTPKGIIVVVNSQQANPPGLQEFVGILKSAGIQVTGEVDTKEPSNKFRIIVGARPD
jgi:hypothetical protein